MNNAQAAPWERLESTRAACKVTGVSFAYWDGDSLHTAVAGVRNSVTGDPITTDTVMHIGSITKIANATLVMQLVDEGKIRLEDPVARHLPDLRLRDPRALEQLTCAMLLNHTSGIDCDVLPDYGPDQERIVDGIARIADAPQLHAPGGGPSYSNSGTVLAGYLVQKLRGESWYTSIKKRIYEPLEMRHAVADLTDLPRFRCSVGDVTDPPTGRPVQTTRPFLPLSFAPAGTTLMMSASDLVTLARAHMSNGLGANGMRILSTESATRMRHPTIAMAQPLGWQWGIGWMLLPGGVIYHGGGGPGVASVLYAHPASGRAFALLTNSDRWDALVPAIAEPILEAWTGLDQRPRPRLAISVDPAPYTGTYQNALYRAEVIPRAGRIALRLSLRTPIYDNAPDHSYPDTPLHPLGEHMFEGVGALPGSPRSEFRFVQPGWDGKMQALGCIWRLLMRVQ